MRKSVCIFIITVLVYFVKHTYAQTEVKIKSDAKYYFGFSVSISGDYLVVGAPQDDSRGTFSGSAYIFKRNGTSWLQEVKLTASDGAAGDEFGTSVSINGDYVVVGAHGKDDAGDGSGAAYVFKRNGTDWSQETKLTAKDATPNTGFGGAVAISGDYVVIGTRGGQSGSVYVFKRAGSIWSQEVKLTGSGANSQFGNAVAIDRDYLVVGAKNVGAAYVFKYDGTNWSQKTSLVTGSGKDDIFGYSVAISGEYAVISAIGDDQGATDSGAAYIFRRYGNIWDQEAKLKASDPGVTDIFGNSVSISGELVLIGAVNNDDNGKDSGSTYIFRRKGASWKQELKLTAKDASAGDVFGYSVSINGKYALAGAPYDDDNGFDAGSAYVYELPDSLVIQPPHDETFTDISASLAGVAWSSAAWGDYDNDGDLDILVTGRAGATSYVSKIYRNDGGSFVDISAPLIGVWESSVAWGDYDNDGDLDILLTGNTAESSNPVSIVYRNDGGTFVDIPASLVGVYQGSAEWGDYDNDGDLDILLSGQSNGVIISKIYRNDKGKFVDILESLAGVYYSSVAWGDYDNDGDLDIFLTGDNASNGFKIYRNESGRFFNVTTALQTFHNPSFDLGDYNGDGNLDILLTGSVSKIYRNIGANFVDTFTLPMPVTYGSTAWGDYDNDGDFDILLTGAVNYGNLITKIYRNDQQAFVDIAASLEGVFSINSVAWGDHDNDGDLDILLTGHTEIGSYIAKIYQNNIRIKNTVPTPPSNLTSSVAGNAVTLSWNKSTDKETAQNGLTYNLRVGTTPGGSEIVSPMANASTGYRKIPQLGNTNHNTRWTIKNLPAGRYYWSVQAIDNAFAGSPFAGEQSFVIGGSIDTTPPTPPKNLQATPGDKQITLKWDANTELDLLRYRIYGGTAPNPTSVVDSVLAALGTTKTLTGLSNGKTYYYRITAVDVALNASGFSNEVNAMPTGSDMPPAPPQNVRAIAGDRQIALYWNRNTESDMNSYRIYGGTSPNPQTVVDSLPFSYYDRGGNFNYSTDVTITGLINGTTYYYRMTAVDNGGNESNFSNEVSATPALPPPAAPKNLQATAGIAQVTLTWNANTEANFLRYRIYGGTSANPTAQIDSAEGRATNSKTINNLAIGATYYFRLKAVNTAMQASGYSNTVTAVPLADKTAPTLANAVYTEPANLNGEVAVAIAATDASGIKNVWLYYRVGGSATFSNRLMARQNGDTYTQTIPAPAITNKGAEFYVTAEDAYGNLAQSRLYPVRVYCPAGIANPNSQPRGKEASFYRLFSIPLSLDEKSPEAFLSVNSSLGAYDKAKYRWYAFERSPRGLREYPNFGNVQMTPDMGFALLVKIQNVKLKTGSGTTVNTTTPYNITLPAGWSLIGNPFHFNIPFDSLRVSRGNFELWRFEGDWQLNTAGLEPWKGYAIWLSQAATFSIRPGVAGLKSATAFYSVENNGAENWLIQISADNGRSVSRFNFVGQNELANDGEDQLDLHEPLRLADGVGLVFARNEATPLKADIRRPSTNGHTWEFTCRLNPEDEVLSLTFDGVATVPPAFEIFLLEPETAMAYNLRANPRLQFATHNLTERRFQLVAGTKAYLHEQNLPAGLRPSSFALLQNFPNPFNPATQIIYSLPEAGHVEVSVYNLRGERVATLVNARQESGSHTVVWNAEKSGSGVYFIKMRAGRVEMMKKCLLVK